MRPLSTPGYTGIGGQHNCSSGGEAGPDYKESFLLGESLGAI